MLRVLLFLLSFSLAFSQTTLAADRTLVAEGDCVARKHGVDKPLAHWKVYRLRSGGYEVESATQDHPILQVFRFDAQFQPAGYSLTIGPLPKVPSDPSAATSMSISCQYGEKELRCDTDYDGHKATTSIAAKKPYVFLPGEFYQLDFSWFLTSVARFASPADAKGNVVNVYTYDDSESKPNEITLKPDDPIKFISRGEETAEVMGKAQVVKKYEFLGLEDFSIVQVTSQGLAASVSTTSDAASGFAMTNYKEHEAWGPTH